MLFAPGFRASFFSPGYMPHDLPDWQLVYHHFDQWRKDKTLKKVDDVLRRKVRRKAGREEEPTAGIEFDQGPQAGEVTTTPAPLTRRLLTIGRNGYSA